MTLYTMAKDFARKVLTSLRENDGDDPIDAIGLPRDFNLIFLINIFRDHGPRIARTVNEAQRYMRDFHGIDMMAFSDATVKELFGDYYAAIMRSPSVYVHKSCTPTNAEFHALVAQESWALFDMIIENLNEIA